MGEWQPTMDSAPKMRRVLVFVPHESFEKAVCIAKFWNGDGMWRREPHGKSLIPTHWQPLPEPPRVEAKGG